MKTILVTGANRGIGFEICRQLAAMGHRVILCSRDIQKGRDAAAKLTGNIFVMQLDVTDEKSIRALVKAVRKQFGVIDVLINNAGIGSRDTSKSSAMIAMIRNSLKTSMRAAWKTMKEAVPVLRKLGILSEIKGASGVPMKSVKRTMETNFYGPWRMTQAFIPLLLKSNDPRIINMSSGMGQLESLTGIAPGYSLSKTSLNALTIMFSNELKEKGIKVNAMCPGWVRTDMGGPDAPRDVAQGADTAVWLATEETIPTGKFFRDRAEIPY